MQQALTPPPAKLLEKLKLTEAEFEQLKRGCHQVYQALGGDFAQAGMKKMRRNALFEVVTDCDHILEHGGPYTRSKRQEWTDLYNNKLHPAITECYRNRSIWRQVVKLVFPCDIYHMD